MAGPNVNLKELAQKVPLKLLVIVFLLWRGGDLAAFMYTSDSELARTKDQYEAVKKENEGLRNRIKQMNEFKKNLDTKRAEMRNLAAELERAKSSLSTQIDVPGFMNTTVTEAKRVGLTVLSIKPTEPANHEYYQEQPFNVVFRGVFVQVVVFFERLANMNNIIRVEAFDLRPTTSSLSRHVNLEGNVQLKTYRYLGSKADDIAAAKSGDAATSPATGGGGK